ncbi:MAG: MFS transporter [Pseudomonadota bacterium]
MRSETIQAQAGAGAWRALWLLFAINFLNFFDRTIPAVVLEPIRHEFGLTDTMLGLLATAFTLVYAVAGIPLGRLSDRLPRNRILGGGVLVWSALTAASGMVTGFWSFFMVRLGVGVGEACCTPAATSLIGDLFPSRQRARAFGIFMLGLPAGSLACFALVGYLAQHYGWRVSFVLAALPGALLAVLVMRMREPRRGAQESYHVDQHAPVARPFRTLMRIRTVWWIILAGVGANFAAYAMSSFLPAFLARYHGMNVAQAGGVSAVVLGLTGVLGLLAGGPLADRLQQRAPHARLLLGAVCFLLAAPLLWLGLTQAQGAGARLTALLAAGWLLYFSFFVSAYPALQDVVDPRLRATATALYVFFAYVLGGGAGALATGMLSDYYAASAQLAAGGSAITETLRGVGLQRALAALVPGAMLLAGLALWMGSRSFTADVRRVAADAAASTKASTSVTRKAS